MSTPSEKPEFPGDHVREEIHAVIKRYGNESDLTVYELLGTLEVVKADLLEMLTNCGREERGE